MVPTRYWVSCQVGMDLVGLSHKSDLGRLLACAQRVRASILFLITNEFSAESLRAYM